MVWMPPDHWPTRHWQRLPDGRVQCNVCPRRCKLREGERGFCFVRQASHGEIVLTTYGRSSGFCVDPIEKKPLFHFLPGTSVLSFGTAGCNLGCRGCQNWRISRTRSFDALAETASPREVAATALRHGCSSVAFTYNDPVVFLEYAVETARVCRARGLRSVAATAGAVLPEARRDLLTHMDAVNIDLKGFTDDFYRDVCAGSLEPVLDTLRWAVHRSRCWVEITNLVIPGLNDGDEDLDAMTKWIARELGPQVPLHFAAFHPSWRLLDVPPTPLSTLRRARAIALRNGLWYVYVGNVHDPPCEATYCRGCGALLIGRTSYRLTRWALDAAGRCSTCGLRCDGVLAGRPGRWGAHRIMVRISGHFRG